MKYLKIASFVLAGLVIAAFALFKDFEVRSDPNWPGTIKLYVNPLTNRHRVVDADDNTTLFYYSVDAFANPINFRKEGNKWVVTFEKR